MKNLFTMAIAGLALALASCSGGDAAVLTSQAARVDSTLTAMAAQNNELMGATKASYDVESKKFDIEVSLADSLINIDMVTPEVFDYFTAGVLKDFGGADFDLLVNTLTKVEGTMDVEIKDVYGKEQTYDLSPAKIRHLLKTKRMQLNPTEVKRQVLKILEAEAAWLGDFEGVTGSSFELNTSFATFTFTFDNARRYRGMVPGQLMTRYMKVLAPRYDAFGQFRQNVIEMLQSLGIDGYRFVYVTEGGKDELKVAVPWSRI